MTSSPDAVVDLRSLWEDREADAEAMIQLIGGLARSRGVVTTIYGRSLGQRLQHRQGFPGGKLGAAEVPGVPVDLEQVLDGGAQCSSPRQWRAARSARAAFVRPPDG